jgi:hypothetical protein
MNRYAAYSMDSPRQRDNALSLTWFWLFLALVFYLAPWVISPGISLTLGAYDLAEWTSLHPAVRFVEPFLLATLFLRLPLVLIVGIIGLNSGPRFSGRWWAAATAVLFISLALLPPLEFFLDARGDINYQQQFALAVGSLVLGAAGLTGWLRPAGNPLTALLALLAIVITVLGIAQVTTLIRDLSLPSSIGAGPVGFAAVMLVLAGSHLWMYYHRFKAFMKNKTG